MSGFGPDGTVDLQDLRVKLYDLLGHRYSAVSPSPGALMLLQAGTLLSSPTGQFECFGRVRGVGFNRKRFSVQEVRAQSDGHTDGGFNGLIVSTSHALPIYGRTIVMPHRGDDNPRHLDGMKRVVFPPHTSDARFEVYADNQVEGRSLISIGFTKSLQGFKSESSPQYPSVAFEGRQMHVVLPTGAIPRFSDDQTFFKHTVAADHIAGEIARIIDIIGQVDAMHACADRHYPAARTVERTEYYQAKLHAVKPMIAAAMKAGIVTDSRRAKYLAHEAAMIDPALHGLIPSV
jgi:hypothetical protein